MTTKQTVAMTKKQKTLYSIGAIAAIVMIAILSAFFVGKHTAKVTAATAATANVDADAQRAIDDAQAAADAAAQAAKSAQKAADSTRETAKSAASSAKDTAQSAKAAQQFANKANDVQPRKVEKVEE